jgi:Tol biopolymer transport system component
MTDSDTARNGDTLSATRAAASAPRSVAGIVLTLIAVVLLSAGPARAAFPGPNGRIAFSADQTSHNQIFSVNPDGTGLSGALTSESANSIGARWSPDGTKLVGAFYASGRGQIYVVNADGSGPTNVSNNAFYDQAPSWSPDGSKIVFERLNASYNAGVYVMNADGSGQTQITAIPSGGFSVGDFNPVWSPNGAKIAFTRYVQGNNLAQIYTMNPDGASQTNITNSSTYFSDGANWSPDSTRIVFSASKPMSSDTDIFVMNADGTSQMNLTNTTATSNLEPTFSPDGTQIAFVREPNTANPHYDLFVIGANGSGAKDITNTPTVDERAPDWGRAPAVVKPTVDSVSASAVGTSGATLDGHVGPGGEAASWHFEYDTVASGAYRSSTTGGVTTSANVTESVQSVLTGLAPSTKYQFRLVASNSAGTTTVDEGTFTTSGPPPMAVTFPPSHVGSTSMDLAGYVNDAGGLDTHYYFQWGLNDGNWHNHSPADPGQDIGSTATLSGHHELAVATLTGLQPNTTYCFRLVAYNSAGVTYADDAHSNPPTAVGMCRRTTAPPVALGLKLITVSSTAVVFSAQWTPGTGPAECRAGVGLLGAGMDVLKAIISPFRPCGGGIDPTGADPRLTGTFSTDHLTPGARYVLVFEVRSPFGDPLITRWAADRPVNAIFLTPPVPTTSHGTVVTKVVVPPGGAKVTAVITNADYCFDSTGHIPPGHVEACIKRVRTVTLGRVTIRHARAGLLRLKIRLSRRERRILRATGKHVLKRSILTVRMTPKGSPTIRSTVRFDLRF